MNPTYIAGLGGALAGGALGSLSGDIDVAAGSALAGLATGSILGGGVTVYKQYQNRKKLEKELGDIKEADIATIKALRKASDRANVPIFIQTSGKPYANAHYQLEANPFINPAEYKLVTQDKDRPNPTPNDPDVIIIGKNYKKLPIIAHELGHAQDFKENKPGFIEKWLPAVGLLATCMGTSFGKEFAVRGKFAAGAASVLAGGLAGLGTAWYGDSKRKAREGVASKKALAYLALLKQKAVEQAQARQLLETAYSTYDPIRMSSKPVFLKNV